jgi:hypothetical protein
MSNYRLTLQTREYFEEAKTIGQAIMEAESLANDLKHMLQAGAEITDNDGTNIILEASSTDPKTMVQLKSLRFEIDE